MRNRGILLRAACLAAALLLLTAVAALADYGVVTTKEITLYAERTLKTPVATLPRYQSLKVKGSASGVTRLIYDGMTVYTKSRNLSRPAEGAGDGRVTLRACDVHCLPSAKSARLRLKKGTELTACGGVGGWTLVSDASSTYFGYVRASDLAASRM